MTLVWLAAPGQDRVLNLHRRKGVWCANGFRALFAPIVTGSEQRGMVRATSRAMRERQTPRRQPALVVVRCVKGQGARSRRRDLQIKHRMMSSLLRTKCKTGRNCHSQAPRRRCRKGRPPVRSRACRRTPGRNRSRVLPGPSGVVLGRALAVLPAGGHRRVASSRLSLAVAGSLSTSPHKKGNGL